MTNLKMVNRTKRLQVSWIINSARRPYLTKKMLLVVTNNNEIQLKNKVFINENQTDYNNEIASYYRKLKKAPLVGNTFWEMEWYILSLRMDEEIRLFAPWVKKYYCLSRFIYWRSNVIDLFHVALLFTSLQGQINK